MNILSHFSLLKNRKVSFAKFMFATLLHKSNGLNISSLIQPKFAVSLPAWTDDVTGDAYMIAKHK